MGEFEDTLAALETAKKRRNQLRRLIENLVRQYKLVKKEITFHENRVEALVKETEFSGYLDTVNVEVKEFPEK
jgi:predicted  nucleic acid-binding Zn-ribbon protein